MTLIKKSDIKKVVASADFSIIQADDANQGLIIPIKSKKDLDGQIEKWCRAYNKLIDFDKFSWYKKDDDIILGFYGPMYRYKKSLGSLVLIASEEDKSGLVIKEFTHGSKYNMDKKKVPASINKMKDLSVLIASELSCWIKGRLESDFMGVVKVESINRIKNKFSMIFSIPSPNGAYDKLIINKIKHFVSNLEFEQIKSYSPVIKNKDDVTIKVDCIHPLEILTF